MVRAWAEVSMVNRGGSGNVELLCGGNPWDNGPCGPAELEGAPLCRYFRVRRKTFTVVGYSPCALFHRPRDLHQYPSLSSI